MSNKLARVSFYSIHDLIDFTRKELIGKHGVIQINLAGRVHVYTGNDVVGNLLQEWLPEWFDYNDVNIKPGPGTQKFPDFTARFPQDGNCDVEIKAWNSLASPAFDLANFHSFMATTYDDPRKLDAYYIVVGYMPSAAGQFSQGFHIEEIHLKRLWEITGPAQKYPIGLQVKRGKVYALRPAKFNRPNPKCFTNKDELILALRDALDRFPIDGSPFSPDEWYKRVSVAP